MSSAYISHFLWSHVLPASGIVFCVVGIFFYGWLKILEGTNRLLKEQNVELKTANKELTDKHNETLCALSAMQGQIDILKSIPLQSIDCTLSKILANLDLTAKTLALNTEVIAKAVEHVKEDLKHDTSHR